MWAAESRSFLDQTARVTTAMTTRASLSVPTIHIKPTRPILTTRMATAPAAATTRGTTTSFSRTTPTITTTTPKATALYVPTEARVPSPNTRGTIVTG